MPTNPNCPSSGQTTLNARRLVCFVNGIFDDGIAGGDVHFFHMAQAAIRAGSRVCLFGGYALGRRLEVQKIPADLVLTETQKRKPSAVRGVAGQIRLFFDMARRLFGSLARLREVRPEDVAYAMSDYWFDTIPLIRCRAQRKILFLGMMAPTLKQVVFRQRADVTISRISSLYYWISQQLSLRWFRWCKGGVVAYGHPQIRDYLLRFGYQESDLWPLPFACDVDAANSVPDQPKVFDVVWAGRVHPQKNIPDLLATMSHLKTCLPDFSALIIGDVQAALGPAVFKMGLGDNITFSGLVADVEKKFTLLKSSRVFVMPSSYESWGIVVGEALVSGVPVVAYQLDCYASVFGDAVRYVKPFDLCSFMATVEDEVQRQRAGTNYLSASKVTNLKEKLKWESAEESFLKLLLADPRLNP